MRQQWAYLQKYKYDFNRVLGDVAWTGLETDSTWPGYQELAASMVDASYDEYGIRTQITITGGSKRDHLRTTDMWVEIIKGREHKFLYAEPVNERNIKEQDLIVKMGRKLLATGLLVAPGYGDDYGGVMKELLAKGAGNAASVHLSRTASDFDWRFVRQGWDVKDYKWPTSLGEGKGPLSSVSSCSDPLRLAMSRAVGILCGGGSFILHNGAGIYGVPKEGSTGFRPANLWETPGIDAIMTAVRDIDSILPEGVEDWTRSNDAWATPPHPLRNHEFWEGKEGRGLNKNYAASSPDGRTFLTAPSGVLKEGKVTARNACRVAVYNPLTPKAPVEIRDLGAGEVLTLIGDPEANAAYLINGIRL